MSDVIVLEQLERNISGEREGKECLERRSGTAQEPQLVSKFHPNNSSGTGSD